MMNAIREMIDLVESFRDDAVKYPIISPDQLREIRSRGVNLEALVGDYIGSGYARTVFECRKFPDQVVKIQINGNSDNMVEWQTWEIARDIPKLSPWFAPCRQKLADGRVILMDRTTGISRNDMPDEYPRLFHSRDLMPDYHDDDEEPGNWGMLNGRPVCHDYGHMDYDHRQDWKARLRDPAMQEMVKWNPDADDFALHAISGGERQ